MPGGIRKDDIEDVEIVDAVELRSDSTTVFITGATVVSTTSSTKRIVFSGIDLIYDKDERTEADDIVVLSGTSGGAADGTFTVAAIIDQTTLEVVEAIADSTGGTADFLYPAGATKVGVDPTLLVFSSQDHVQGVLEDLDNGLNVGHKALRHLIHFIDDGPACGFASGAYKEILPAGNPFPTQAIWWESAAKLKKIVEFNVTRDVQKKPTTEEWKMYATDGSTVLCTVTDTITYSGVSEDTRTRAVS